MSAEKRGVGQQEPQACLLLKGEMELELLARREGICRMLSLGTSV